ncbi:hypothetical protein J27TS7_15060 [Paenibacillus dendritiformis]|uniref:DUF4340 domain-containing protein n=1 Tax=Paenibacillus dendritiformis TaxID=130049 RepID=UPI001B1DAD61|nr:DUF4340 domain-containing protein [Paenibacillus dendritiformis]GIO71992.1 hypothetical protein J27TS7_15060 [Paenibacillus dendritiformis]
MKKLMPAALLVIVFGILYWYASSNHFFLETGKEAESAPVLVKAEAEQVNAIELDAGGKKLKLVKVKEDWKVQGNEDYPVSSYAAADWISTFTGVTGQAVVEEDAEDLAKYGLDHPAAVYSISEGGNVRRIEVGGNTPVPGTVYARIAGAKTVFQVAESELSGLKRSLFDFSRKEPLTFALEEVREFKWTGDGQTFDLRRDTKKDSSADEGENWSLNGEKLTQEKATSLLNAFRFLNTDREPERADALTGSGAKPDWTLTITLQPEAVDPGEAQEKAVTKRYGGYMKEEHMWIIPDGEGWAYPVEESSFQEAVQTWQDVEKREESESAQK